jgi:hypothetical protein
LLIIYLLLEGVRWVKEVEASIESIGVGFEKYNEEQFDT